MKRAAITLDVDSLRFYRAIHGLGSIEARPSDADDPIYRVAIPRFFDLLEECGIAATLFLIAEDSSRFPEAFQRVKATGSEIASHSYSHDYSLSRRSVATIEADLLRAHELLKEQNGGVAPVGFRAPGYNVSPALLGAVTKLGYRYDSSLLPSPLYFAARGAAIGLYALLRRPSQSLLGDLRQFSSPTEPYRMQPETPWKIDPGGPLVEIPMAVEPTSRAPFIGTSLVLLPERAQGLATRRVLRKLDCINFEMHAIDLLDPSDDPDLLALAASQRDLRVPAAIKMRSFSRLFHTLASEAEVLPLHRIAAAF